MKKKFCEYCGTSLSVKCHTSCGIDINENSIDWIKVSSVVEDIGLEFEIGFGSSLVEESKDVNLTGLPAPDDASKLAAEVLRDKVNKDGMAHNIIEFATSGPTLGSCPPVCTNNERKRFEMINQMGQNIIEERTPIKMDPSAVLSEINPRLLSVAMTGADVVGRDFEHLEEFNRVMDKLDEPDRIRKSREDKHYAEMLSLLKDGKAVAKAICGVPNDFTPIRHITSNKIETLHEFMSVEVASDEFPMEIRFIVPTQGKISMDHPAKVTGNNSTQRYVHLDSMPLELQKVIKRYLGVIRCQHEDHKRSMNNFRESVFELAASIVIANKTKKTG